MQARGVQQAVEPLEAPSLPCQLEDELAEGERSCNDDEPEDDGAEERHAAGRGRKGEERETHMMR